MVQPIEAHHISRSIYQYQYINTHRHTHTYIYIFTHLYASVHGISLNSNFPIDQVTQPEKEAVFGVVSEVLQIIGHQLEQLALEESIEEMEEMGGMYVEVSMVPP